jgi:hypothetical protein
MREPPNPRVMMLAAKRSENRSCPNHIASCAKFDDKDVFRDRLVILAAIAMRSKLFVWSAGNITAKMAAILLVKKRE